MFTSQIITFLPLTPSKDNDTDQAFSMVEYFKRNGVEVKELTKDIGDYKKRRFSD